LGLGPEITREVDIVAVLSGCDLPFVLRPEWGHYKLVGECYVEGIMHGEALVASLAQQPIQRTLDVVIGVVGWKDMAIVDPEWLEIG
jgi:hypothetical protein